MEYNTEEYYKELEKNKNRIISDMCKLYGSNITLRSEKLHPFKDKITESYSIIKDECNYWKIQHCNNICKTPISVQIEMRAERLTKIKSTHKKEIIEASYIVCPEDIIHPSNTFYVNKKCTDINKDEINQALKESNLDVDAMISNIKEINCKMPKANVTNFPDPQWELGIEILKHSIQIEEELKKIDNGVNYI